MDIKLLLNSAESEPSETANSTKSLEVLQSGPYMYTERITIINSETYLIPYQTLNLRHGLCTMHPTSLPLKHTFSHEEDVLMQYMIDNIQSGCVTILGLCLNRGLRTINTRWNVLDDYEPCSRCIQCQ